MAEGREIYPVVLELLRTRGKVEAYNVIRAQYHVYDDRIDIQGILPLDLLGTPESLFEQINVTLKMPSERRLHFPDGSPEYEPNEETLVYYVRLAKGVPLILFYRPGLWERYVQQLHQEDIKDRAYNDKLNNAPVDDNSLFNEFLSPDDHP